MAFRTAFFAFPNEPEELKLAIVAANLRRRPSSVARSSSVQSPRRLLTNLRETAQGEGAGVSGLRRRQQQQGRSLL